MPSQLMICSTKPRNSTSETSTHRLALIKAKKRSLVMLALTFVYLLLKINIHFIKDTDYETTY